VNTEKQIIDALYAKLAGLSFDRDIHLDDGAILIPFSARVRKSHIAKAVRAGAVSQLIELLVADPAQLGKMGTKRIRDGLDILAQSHQKDGAHLARSLSELLRRKDQK